MTRGKEHVRRPTSKRVARILGSGAFRWEPSPKSPAECPDLVPGSGLHVVRGHFFMTPQRACGLEFVSHKEDFSVAVSN